MGVERLGSFLQRTLRDGISARFDGVSEDNIRTDRVAPSGVSETQQDTGAPRTTAQSLAAGASLPFNVTTGQILTGTVLVLGVLAIVRFLK